MKKGVLLLLPTLLLLVSCQANSTGIYSNYPEKAQPDSTAMVSLKLVSNKIFCNQNDQVAEDGDWANYYLGFRSDSPDPIGMILNFAGSKIDGVFFYAHQTEELTVIGCLQGEQGITLDVLNASGEKIASFLGKFTDLDQQGMITGTWTDQATQKKSNIELELETEAAEPWPGGTNEYFAAGVKDDEVVNRAALRFLEAVTADDKNSVASMIDFPVKVEFNGQHEQIANEKEFNAIYSQVFTADFKTLLAKAMPKHMTANHSGIMLAQGDVWFNADGKITAINTQ